MLETGSLENVSSPQLRHALLRVPLFANTYLAVAVEDETGCEGGPSIFLVTIDSPE